MSDRYPQLPPETLSVTEILKLSGVIPESTFIDPWFMGRGTAAHKATELHDKGILDESTVDPEIAGMVESWRKLGYKYAPENIEVVLYDPVYRFCGKLDRIPLLDVKGPSSSKWHVLQLGAYWHLLGVAGRSAERVRPMTAHLQTDGSIANIKTYTSQQMHEAAREFLTLLAAIRIKQKYT